MGVDSVAEVADVEALVAQVRAGQEPAWGCLMQQFAGLVYWIARRHQLSAADTADVTQTCWLRLMENLDRIDRPERLGAWLATTARRECVAVRRRGQRERVGTEAHVDAVSVAEAVDVDLIATERDAALWEAIATLSRPCPALLTLLLRDPRPTYDEVVADLHMPKGSVGPRRARCLQQLRHRLESRDHGAS